MDLSISSLLQGIKGYYAKLSKRNKIVLAALLVCVLAGSVILATVLGNANYTVLYSGLSSSEGAEIVNLLDNMNTDYKVRDDGTIVVPKANIAMLKMQLAAEGYPKSTLGYDIFTSQSALMTTDYEKRQYLIFQLQDRLQESLRTLVGVKNAIVTLNVPEENSYVLKSDKTVATASVVLDLYSYANLSNKQIMGIEELVAKSVPGLTNDNVAIVDTTGAVLNDSSTGQSSESGTAMYQIEIIRQINEYYKEKITKFLEPVFGTNGMSVAVSVQVDFQKKTSEQTTYTPVGTGTTGILSKEEYNRQSTNGGTVQQNVAGTEANTGTPTYQQGATATNAPQDTSATESGSNEYLVNKLIEDIEDHGGQIKDMTVAVMINSSSLSDEMAEKYQQMVAFAAGVPVEKVVITHAEFTAKAQTPGSTVSGATQPVLDLNSLEIPIAIGAGLLLLIIILASLRSKRQKKRTAPKPIPGMATAQKPAAKQEKKVERKQDRKAPPEEEEQETGPESAAAPVSKPLSKPEIVLSETREQGIKRQVQDFAANNPEMVAQMLRTWMKEDDTK